MPTLVWRSPTLYQTTMRGKGLVTKLYQSCSGGMWKWPVLYLAPPPFSARVVYAITFSIQQLLFQRLFTALAVLRTCQSHLETEESLCPILLATQLQDSKLCLDGTFSSGSNCSNLLAIDTDNQKGAEEEHSKDSILCWKDGKNIPPSKERHDNFQLQAIQCVIL